MSSRRAAASRWAVARRDGWGCHYCGRRLGVTSATAEHVVPRSWGGHTVLRNLVLACSRCNGSRGSELVVCGCRFCVAARLHWHSHHASSRARRAVVAAALDLRGSAALWWLPEPV